MNNYRCIDCGAEYEEIPYNGCTRPGCNNNNPIMFEFIGSLDPEPVQPPPPPLPPQPPQPSQNKIGLKIKLPQKKEVAPPVDTSVNNNPVYPPQPPKPPVIPDDKNPVYPPQPPRPFPPPGPTVTTKTFKETYRMAKQLYAEGTKDSLDRAGEMFRSIPSYKNAGVMAAKCDQEIEKIIIKEMDATYKTAKQHASAKKSLDQQKKALELFHSLKGFKDADKLAKDCQNRIEKLENPNSTKLKPIIIGIVIITVTLLAFMYILFAFILPNL